MVQDQITSLIAMDGPSVSRVLLAHRLLLHRHPRKAGRIGLALYPSGFSYEF